MSGNHHITNRLAPSGRRTLYEDWHLRRVSTKDQSCELQLRDLRAYCTARQLTSVREYVDTGVSGTKDSRPQLNELMNDVRKRKLDAVIVWRFDRFARSTKHLLSALEEFRSLGVGFISYQENIETARLLGRRSSQSLRPLRSLSAI